MKNTKPHVGRLIKFGQHIGKGFLKQALLINNLKYKAGKADCMIEHFDWALKQLPQIDLKHWRYHQDGTPYLVTHPGLNSITASAVYFNLDVDQLFHLFVPGYQDPNFGEALNVNTDPSELALNINRFAEYFMPDEDEQICNVISLKKGKKVKKFKLKNVA